MAGTRAGLSILTPNEDWVQEQVASSEFASRLLSSRGKCKPAQFLCAQGFGHVFKCSPVIPNPNPAQFLRAHSYRHILKHSSVFLNASPAHLFRTLVFGYSFKAPSPP